MAGLADAFLTPLGLLALLAVVPLLLLYLVRPDPRRLRLPTLEFLVVADESGVDSPALQRLRRNLLLLVQVVVVVLLALALASPYITTLGTATTAETVVVLDTSASMAVEDAGGSRFATAREIARESVSETTSVVTAGATPRVRLQRGAAADARGTLARVERTDAAGDLGAAISAATAVADADARVVVVSDFAGAGWREAVETARGRGYQVDLRPVGGSVPNVGIVGAEYERSTVTVSVKSYADGPVERTVRLGEAEETVALDPGDVGTVTLPVPVGDATVRLAPGDRFPVDDRLHVAGPDARTVRVLLVTNNPRRDRFIRAALSVPETVDATVAEPPTAVDAEYDVVVFGTVDRTRLLESTRETAARITREGGGTVIVAQDRLGEVGYGPLLPVEPTGRTERPTLRSRTDRLTRGISFPPPEAAPTAVLKNGSSAVVTADGSPLLARGRLGQGRTLYYGYLPDESEFQFNYQYPVLWKRLVFEAAGRAPLDETNRRTGGRLSVANGTTVVGPDGERTVDGAVRLDAAGHYRAGDRRVSASLLDDAESNVSAPALQSGPDGIAGEREETVERPLDLSPGVALVAVGAVLVEVALLRRRGDL